MNKWVCVRTNSLIVSTVSFADDAYDPPPNPDGSIYARVPLDSDDNVLLQSWFNFATQEIEPLPPKPDADSYYKWDWQNAAWVYDDDAAIKAVTNQRDSSLRASDWTQLPDVPLANKAEWATYRQALRDVPQQSGYPQHVIWPQKPS